MTIFLFYFNFIYLKIYTPLISYTDDQDEPFQSRLAIKDKDQEAAPPSKDKVEDEKAARVSLANKLYTKF